MSNYIGDDTKGQSPYESPADVDRSNGTLVMATNAYFEPYEYYDGDKIVGIDADMAQAVCDVLGYELVIEDMEFDAIINAIQSGKADIGVAGIHGDGGPSAERGLHRFLCDLQAGYRRKRVRIGQMKGSEAKLWSLFDTTGN